MFNIYIEVVEINCIINFKFSNSLRILKNGWSYTSNESFQQMFSIESRTVNIDQL